MVIVKNKGMPLFVNIFPEFFHINASSTHKNNENQSEVVYKTFWGRGGWRLEPSVGRLHIHIHLSVVTLRYIRQEHAFESLNDR